MTTEKNEGPVGREALTNATPEAYHATLQDATAWALDRIAAAGTNVEWLRKANVPMFLRDNTPDEQKLLERIVLLEDGLRRLLWQADLGQPDLVPWYVRTIAAELGVK